MTFKDNFSRVSKDYAAHRPTYPPELFHWLAEISPATNAVWDCACGNGQASLNLAEFFTHVHATDASPQQIEAAPKSRSNISWQVAPAEASGLAPRSVDLITVAQALHWFDLPAFFAEAKRVLRPGGILAVWCYGLNEVEGAEANAITYDFYENVVGPFWPPDRRLVEEGYRNIEFPFEELEAPDFRMERRWTLDQLLGYFSTWSAVTKYKAALQRDPIEDLRARLGKVWPENESRLIRWPLSVRAGRLKE